MRGEGYRLSLRRRLIQIVDAAQKITVRVYQHKHSQTVRLTDRQHPRRGPAKARQLASFAEVGKERVQVVNAQAGTTSGPFRIDRDREELQCDRASTEDHPAVVPEIDGKPQSGVERCCSIEVCTWQIGSGSVHVPTFRKDDT